jgi:hypothetical protein
MAEPAGSSNSLRSITSVRAERQHALEARFGGMDWWADFLGFAVAIFFTTVLFGIVGAIVGTVGYQMHATVPKVGSSVPGTTQQLGLGGLIGGLIALFLAYLIGGYAAGRMARFNGAQNGVGVVIWTIIVAIVLGILGAILGNRFNVGTTLNLHIDTTTVGVAGLISLVVTLVVMLLAATIGGKMGERYHRPIDRQAGLI